MILTKWCQKTNKLLNTNSFRKKEKKVNGTTKHFTFEWNCLWCLKENVFVTLTKPLKRTGQWSLSSRRLIILITRYKRTSLDWNHTKAWKWNKSEMIWKWQTSTTLIWVGIFQPRWLGFWFHQFLRNNMSIGWKW